MAEVTLRPVVEDDIEIFYEHQRDPAGAEMSAFPPRDHAAHVAHWRKITSDPSCITKAIVVDGEVAGTLGSWGEDGTREIGYVLGRTFWGKGIATQALSVFLEDFADRPIVAWAAEQNVASIRVLEKCGFERAAEQPEPDERGVRYVVMELRG